MALLNRVDIATKLGQGLGTSAGLRSSTTIAATAANAAAGHLTAQGIANGIGTSYPTTIVGLPVPLPSAGALRLIMNAAASDTAAARHVWLARFYKFGTAPLNAVDSTALVHDAATFPVTRTSLNTAASPLALIPLAVITTATATTAPVFSISYTSQAGSSVVGTKTMTMPAAATALGSGYIIRLENGDSGVRDITEVNVTTAGSAGAMALYGVELLSPIIAPVGAIASIHDAVSGGFSMADIVPAVATSGTADTFLGLISLGQVTASVEYNLAIHAVVDA